MKCEQEHEGSGAYTMLDQPSVLPLPSDPMRMLSLGAAACPASQPPAARSPLLLSPLAQQRLTVVETTLTSTHIQKNQRSVCMDPSVFRRRHLSHRSPLRVASSVGGATHRRDPAAANLAMLMVMFSSHPSALRLRLPVLVLLVR